MAHVLSCIVYILLENPMVCQLAECIDISDYLILSIFFKDFTKENPEKRLKNVSYYI